MFLEYVFVSFNNTMILFQLCIRTHCTKYRFELEPTPISICRLPKSNSKVSHSYKISIGLPTVLEEMFKYLAIQFASHL